MSDNGHIKHYLLVVDRLRSTRVRIDEYENASEATRAYHAAEKTYGSRSGYDIVLIGSDSIETVQRTHASYFVDGEQPALLDEMTKFAPAHVEFADAFKTFTRARRKAGATSPRAAK